MLKCLAGICGDTASATEAAAAAAASLPEAPRVVKPTLRLDEAPAPAPASFEDLAERLDLMTAPPGAVKPTAVVSKDFPRNVLRLLVLVPSDGASEGAWDAAASDGRGDVVPIIRWAQANNYAVCLFSGAALRASPAQTWDNVLRGSPAGSVSILTASGSLPLLGAALAPMHPLLYGRFRLAVEPFAGDAAWPPTWPEGLPDELKQHLKAMAARAPAAWAREVRASVALQELFELLALRESRFQKGEARKYTGFQNLKENDMPGFKRLTADERIKRLDRDRGDDELARLLRKNERADQGNDEDWPDVD